jgi:cobalt-zinc-cadmium efflux system membrane fusion protein
MNDRLERRARARVFVAALIASSSSIGCAKRSDDPNRAIEARSPVATTIAIDADLLKRGRVQVAAATREVPRPTLVIAAELQSAEGEAAIVSSLVAGRVARVEGNLGDRVRAGQALVTVQAPEVARLRAEARRADARLELASKALERLEELGAEGAASRASIEGASAERVGARADLEALRTQLAGLGLKVDDGGDGASQVVLRSPIDGVVAERRALLGASVSPGDALFRVVAESARAAVARVPESKALAVTVGAAVRVRPREAEVAGAEPCAGVVERITGVVDDDRTVRVRVRLDEGCAHKASGRTLTIEVPLTNDGDAHEPAILVPAGAVVELRGKSVVFVQEGDAPVFAWRAVRAGARVGSSVVIEDGVREGERVVVRGTVLLKGEVVRAEPIE